MTSKDSVAQALLPVPMGPASPRKFMKTGSPDDVALILSILLPCALLAQTTPPRAEFETADIHASAPGTREGGGFLPEGRFECRGTTVLRLIATAYNVNTDRVVGGPDWLGSDRFDITAKAPPRRTAPAALQGMLQSLLADRFGLDVHKDQKDLPVYLLTVGKKGPKLRKAAASSAPECPSADGPPGMNHRACRAYSMPDLSRLLPQIAGTYVDRPVVDATGLDGRYDFRLDWVGKAGYLAAKANPEGPLPTSIFDALDKLGLKLEPGTHPEPVIVVDYVNRAPIEYAPPPGPTGFEVAEVRAGKPGAMPSLTARNGRLEILSFPLRKLIALAFELKDEMVTGGPKWLDADSFDVIAKSTEVMSPHAMAGMLKTLIVERFKLETHSEEQPAPVFALSLGKRAPKLNEAGGSGHSECRSSLGAAGITCTCRNTTMAQLAERLPDIAGAYIVHPMVDLTGLKGAYDFSLIWTPRARLADFASGRAETGVNLTVFEAIDQQLGLKLEEQKHPMPVIVIDRVERSLQE